MPALSVIGESMIRQRAGDGPFARGKEYVRRGAVVRLERRGDQIMAEV